MPDCGVGRVRAHRQTVDQLRAQQIVAHRFLIGEGAQAVAGENRAVEGAVETPRQIVERRIVVDGAQHFAVGRAEPRRLRFPAHGFAVDQPSKRIVQRAERTRLFGVQPQRPPQILDGPRIFGLQLGGVNVGAAHLGDRLVLRPLEDVADAPEGETDHQQPQEALDQQASRPLADRCQHAPRVPRTVENRKDRRPARHGRGAAATRQYARSRALW